MVEPLSRPERAFLILALIALVGWSGLAYFAWSARSLTQQLDTVAGDHKTMTAKYLALQNTAGELNEVQAQLSAIRMEEIQAAEAGRETKAKTLAAQQELATYTKRLEQARERASHRGSVRQADAAKR
jgi:septation ring formation regulator EzrA